MNSVKPAYPDVGDTLIFEGSISKSINFLTDDLSLTGMVYVNVLVTPLLLETVAVIV